MPAQTRSPRRRARGLRAGFVLLLASQLTLLPVSAACLFKDYSVEGELDRSALVVIADVTSERALPGSDDSKSIGGVLYTIKVLETFRGSAKPTTVVFSDNSSGRFPMTVGQR